MHEIVRFEGVSYAYEGEREAVKNLSVTLYDTQRVALLGKNGAGKSTFFQLVNGVLHPTKGEVFFVGNQITKKELQLYARRKAIGLVFQDPDVQILAPTVEEEISFGPMNLGLSRQQVQQKVDDAIAQFDLEELRTRAPQYLSGGEKKRVTLADVLAMEPKLLLLDEPTASLDVANTKRLLETLYQLQQKKLGLIIATHDMDFAWQWAERILLFHDGQIVSDCTPMELFEKEDLLQLCGLRLPYLYQVGKLLHLERIPRTIQELEEEIKCI